MYQRHKYVEGKAKLEDLTDDHVGTVKYDGSAFFMAVQPNGSALYTSRRMGVKGNYPERSAQIPHLAHVQIPQYSGNVYHVELIHT